MQFKTPTPTTVSPLLKEPINKLKLLMDNTTYATPESFISLPQDLQFLQKAMEVASGFNLEKLKYLFLVGIGGSSLGTQAIFNALGKKNVEIIFLDTISQSNLRDISDLTNKIGSIDEFLINYVSKSGNTTESTINLAYLQETLTKKFGDVKSRIVTTSKVGSATTLEIPENISGRFSVFSAVGLFPLLVASFNVKKLLEGAKLQNNDLETPAISATRIFEEMSKDCCICENFFFNPEMEYVGKWLRQLMGESLGKDGRGIFPAVSIGTNDLHSMYQLYLGGPKNIYTNFVSGNSNNEILENIYSAVKTTYTNNILPYAEFILDDINEFELGRFMQFKMLETYFLAQLLKVNAFNQPSVEQYKDLFRRSLKRTQ